MLDFPLDPPDAEAVTFAGQDFGVFRRRYDKFHTGEDWWLSRGRSNFGLPVYSVGHGLVTYAEPDGWGRDGGAVVIRHYFPDGSTFHSFYGHLDPPSVVLSAGDCVIRGEQVGNIGRPRTPPHLHFEIRSHLPYAPGPGYWPEDPTLAGWQSPSQFIWNNRIAASPGVRWMRPAGENRTRIIGIVDQDVIVLLEESLLVGINIADGSTAWRLSRPAEIDNALIDAGQQLIYVAGRRGQIEAFRLPGGTSGLGSDAGSELGEASHLDVQPLWTADLDVVGGTTLMPLPEGGLVVSVWQEMFGISARGQVKWEYESDSRPADWLLAGDQLLYLTGGREQPLWIVNETGPVAWNEPLSGRLLFQGNQILLYAEDGLFRLNPDEFTSERLVELPESYLGLGDVIALSDGGLLLAHRDLADRRLIALDENADPYWERSYDDLIQGQTHLLRIGDRPYLVSLSSQGSLTELSIFLVDMERSQLTRLFTGGTRSGYSNDAGVQMAGDSLPLINIGGSLAAFDPQAALEIVAPE